MSDKEILRKLNNESKKLINDFYSIASFINKNESNLEYPSIKDMDELITYSCFLATIKNDNVISSFFDAYGITYENIINLFKFNNDISFNDICFKNALNSDMLTEISLSKLFKKVLVKLKYSNYLEEKEVYANDINDYQIFDYLTDENRELIFDLINNSTLKSGENLELLLANHLHNLYLQYIAYQYNNDKEQKMVDNQLIYDFDSCQIKIKDGISYLTFKENASMIDIIVHINKNLDNPNTEDKSRERKISFINKNPLPCTFEINSIDHNKPDKEWIEVILSDKNGHDKIPFEITNYNNETYVIWLSKKQTFINAKVIGKGIEVSTPVEKKEEKKITQTPFLDKYGFDLTNDKYIKDPSVGRDDVIRRIEQILLYPERDKSIIITGVAGCGKTAIAKGLAYRIQKGDVPKALKNLRIISIDSATLVAGTKYVGTLEEKMKNILDEASESKDIILFIDEIHQALGAGKSENDSTSVSEILKPYLDYGRVRVIGATTSEEYNEFVSCDAAFKTRFRKINIDEPDNNIIYQILDDLITSYNRLSEVDNITCPKLDVNEEEKDTIIKWLMDSTAKKYRVQNDSCSNPRLVLDIIKEAYAIAAMRDSDLVTIDDIKEALMLEERLYKYSRERQIENIKYYKPIQKKDNIIRFSLIKKED